LSRAGKAAAVQPVRRPRPGLAIPAKAALFVAVFAAAAIAIAVAGLLLIDRHSRELDAAEGAARDLASLTRKLPGILDDPALAVMGRTALQEIDRIADEEGQERIVRVRRAGTPPADWPEVQPFGEDFILFSEGGTRAAGRRIVLADGSEVLVGRPVAETGPLQATLFGWGIVISVLIVALAALAAFVVGRAISRRLGNLNQLCDEVERGAVDARHIVRGRDEIALLAAHMNRMLDELQRRMEALRDTTDGLAHDLRTPLARVQGRLTRIEDMADDDRFGAEVRVASGELERLMDSFNALLELREIETETALTPDRFDVAAAVEDAAELYEAVAEDEHGITFERDLQTCRAAGNASLIVRAAANMIDNAIKASPNGGRIRIATACSGTAVEISVRDWGVGLTGQRQARSTFGGHGIGLRIVRAVARRHGGEFTLTALNQGVQAILKLPIAPQERQVS
jgi:signal transduction histidine kinase